MTEPEDKGLPKASKEGIDELSEDKTPIKATKDELEEEYERRSPMKSLPDIKSGMIKTAIVSFVVALVVFVGIGMMGGGSFLTKADFESNLTGMNATIEQAKLDLVQAQTSVNNAVQGIPNTITTTVNSALTQTVTQLNERISTLTNQVNTLNSTIPNTITTAVNSVLAQTVKEFNEEISILTNQVNAIDSSVNSSIKDNSDKISELIGKVDSATTKIDSTNTNLSKAISDLSVEVGVLEAKVEFYETRIKAIEDKFTKKEEDNPAGSEPFSYSFSVRDDGFPTTDISPFVTTASVRIALTNETDFDVEDIGIEFELDFYGDDADISIRPSISLAGWRVKDWGGNYVILKGTGLVLEASDKYSKILNMTLTWAGTTNGTAEIDDDYIEITNWSYE